ncbi:39S ribosomal L33, mitochondrial [Paramuricea clavata]|uniref:Large ribosomal subunit protein bL33m n=1 Tax=Paramuricea clavata TaxID=317549 RepID=A0A6S7GIC7_PARCT|nr:39S ribosomal L33, mitochondrial [Paramuricea clavata]
MLYETMFLTVFSRSMLVRLVSAAGTGYFYTMRRNRARPDKLVLMKHDPIVNKHVLFVETKVKKGASSR